MRIAEGKNVNVTGIRPELLFGLLVLEGVMANHGFDLIITSLNDSAHSPTSLHYAGAAADIRIWGIADVTLNRIVGEAKRRLGVDFDVVLEEDHIHLEWQPRRR